MAGVVVQSLRRQATVPFFPLYRQYTHWPECLKAVLRSSESPSFIVKQNKINSGLQQQSYLMEKESDGAIPTLFYLAPLHTSNLIHNNP